MGTEWWLRADGASAVQIDRAVELVTRLERRLSRFDTGSALSRLNRERAIEDEDVATVVREAERLRHLTNGGFDARCGAAVIASGYDRSFERLDSVAAVRADTRRPNVTIDAGSRVALDGEGALDLGGIAKGWAVERAADLLSETGACLVDGGGDIAARGRPARDQDWLVGVGEGLAVSLRDRAVATSSTLRRRWRVDDGVAHHIVEPLSGLPAWTVASAVVVAPSAAVADALATALVADAAPSLLALPALDAEALLQRPDGRWEMTPGMERFLR